MATKEVFNFQVECASDQIGYGRRRRDVEQESNLNKIYEVSMSTIVRVANDDSEDKEKQVWLEKATLNEEVYADELAIAALSEEFGAYKYVDFQEEEEDQKNSAPEMSKFHLIFIAALFLKLALYK